MKTIQFYEANEPKPFASVDLSEREFKGLKSEAKLRGISVGQTAVLAVDQYLATGKLFTSEADAVAQRLIRDHPGLTMLSIIIAALNETMSALEEDVAEDGWLDGGAGERMFVRQANRARAGKPLYWQVGSLYPQHEIGSKTFAAMIRADRRRERGRLRQELLQTA